MLAVNAVSMTTLATFGAIGAASYGIVKVTQNIREEAKRRLKVEEGITGAINNQIISQREALQNLQKTREEAQKMREFNRFLNDSTIEDLTRRKSTLEQLKNIIPATLPVIENGKVISKPNENFIKTAEDLKALDAQIDALQQKNIRGANDSFGQRWESWKKSQEDTIKAEEKHNALIEKNKQDIEKAKEQIVQLK